MFNEAPEGSVFRRRARRRLFAAAMTAQARGQSYRTWLDNPRHADDFDAVSSRDVRALIAYAWGVE